MKLSNPFVPNEVPDQPDQLSEGWHELTVIKCEERLNRQQTGSYFLVGCMSTKEEGLVWATYSRTHHYGQKLLKDLCLACGISEFVDTDQLLGETFWGRLELGQPSGGYDAKMEIKEVRGLSKRDSGDEPAPSSKPAKKATASRQAKASQMNDFDDDIPF